MSLSDSEIDQPKKKVGGPIRCSCDKTKSSYMCERKAKYSDVEHESGRQSYCATQVQIREEKGFPENESDKKQHFFCCNYVYLFQHHLSAIKNLKQMDMNGMFLRVLEENAQ